MSIADDHHGLIQARRVLTSGTEMAGGIRTMAMGHVLFAIATGISVAITAPRDAIGSFALVGQLPGWPWLYGLTLAGFAVMARSRKVLPSSVGLWGMIVWYALYAGNFLTAYVLWMIPEFNIEGRPNVYPVFVYGLTVYLLWHHYVLRNTVAAWSSAVGEVGDRDQ